MRSSGILSLALTTLVGISMVSAASPHGKFDRRNHKAIIADRQAKEATVNGIPEAAINKRTSKVSRKYKKRGGKICRVKDAAAPSSLASSSSSAASSASSTASSTQSQSESWASSTAAATPTVVAAVLQPASTTWASTSSDAPWGGNWHNSQSSSSAWSSDTWAAPTSTSSSSAAPSATQAPPSNSGLLYADGPCGANQPSADHPNGAPWWLNCGLDSSGGWNPPSIKAKDLISITDPSTHPEVFGGCLEYQSIFADAAASYNMPTALLMSIGMQESGCKRSAVGARGEQGIMQVAGNACDNPSGDCQEPWYNIHKGASILVDKMGGNPDGNIVSALGQYNGWMPGMYAANGAQYGPQGQKVSYLDDMLNKWLQGKSSY